MQKVLVSAGAVGAAALELNNNQATEVVEAAPHGVQQRRRSQSKKEEPAALIKRGHTVAKAHHGNSAARVQNAGQVFWIVFGILGILGLALGLGLGLGLPSAVTCPDVNNNNFASKATKKVCVCQANPVAGQTPEQVKCTLLTKADYDAFEAAQCTQINGDLIVDTLVVLQGANAVEKLDFDHLIEINNGGGVRVNRQGSVQTTKQIVFKKLTKIDATFEVGGQTLGADAAAFETLTANCLQEASEIAVFLVGNLKTFELDRLEKLTKRFLVDDVGTATSGSSYSFNKLQEIGTMLDVKSSATNGNTNKWSFKYKGLKMVDLAVTVAYATGGTNCVVDALEINFARTTEVFISRTAFFIRSGPGAAFLNFKGQNPVNANAAGFDGLNPRVKESAGGADTPVTPVGQTPCT